MASREFETGATRDEDEDKIDYEGHLSPLALTTFCEYMHSHRNMPDGTKRASDNWQKGIPQDAYVKSMFRHMMDVWANHRKVPSGEPMEVALCGVIFNAMGLLHEIEASKRSTLDSWGHSP